MADTTPASTPRYRRQAGTGRAMTPAEMQQYIARYRDLREDPNAFPGVTSDASRRRICYVISPDNLAGPAAITTPHHFHLSYLESELGKAPPLHAHPYAEIFICLQGKYAIAWGDDGEHVVELEQYDTFSVPPGVMRKVYNVSDGPGMIIGIYDGGGDPLSGITVPQSVIDELGYDR
jgi:mannose-6-phosphate isomerase-like protein (cupin superfamily)